MQDPEVVSASFKVCAVLRMLLREEVGYPQPKSGTCGERQCRCHTATCFATADLGAAPFTQGS